MPRAVLEGQPVVDSAIIEAMQTWPEVEEDYSPVLIPPSFPKPCSSDTKLLSHDTTMESCVNNISRLFSVALQLHSSSVIGKAHSTRSKTRQLLDEPSPDLQTTPKKAKTSSLNQESIPENTPEREEVTQETTVNPALRLFPTTQETMSLESSEDFAGGFIECCKEGYITHPSSVVLLQEATAPHWVNQNDLWFYKGALYVPDHYNLRTECISKYHDAPMQGHPDSHRTYQAVKRFYYWPLMRSDIMEYVQTCDSCQRHKKSTSLPSGLLQATPIPPPNDKGRHWIVDFATKLPLTESGHCEIMVMRSWDKFTVLRECAPGMGAEGAANLFLQSVRVFGTPKTFRGDRGSRFNTKIFTDILEKAGCEINLASVDHHQSVGAAEQNNFLRSSKL